MERTILDLFKPEIDRRIDEAVTQAVTQAETRTTQELLYEFVQDGYITTDIAAMKAGLTRADFTSRMTEAGYIVPQGV